MSMITLEVLDAAVPARCVMVEGLPVEVVRLTSSYELSRAFSWGCH